MEEALFPFMLLRSKEVSSLIFSVTILKIYIFQKICKVLINNICRTIIFIFLDGTLNKNRILLSDDVVFADLFNKFQCSLQIMVTPTK